MSSKPDKKHEENIEDTTKKAPGQQSDQPVQTQKKNEQWEQGQNPRGGEQRGGRQQ